MTRAKVIVCFNSVSSPADCSSPMDVASTDSLRTLSRRPSMISRKVPTVMMPTPPTWISDRMTTCPNVEKTEPMSTTLRPVTQVALVDVKSATSSGTGVPLALAMGSHSSRVPARIVARKAATRMPCGRAAWLFCRK